MSTVDAKELLRQYVKEAKLIVKSPAAWGPDNDFVLEFVERLSEVQV